MPRDITYDKPLSVQEVMELLNVSDQTVYRLFDSGELQGFRVGRKRLITLKSVESFKIRKSNLACQMPTKVIQKSRKKPSKQFIDSFAPRYL